MREQDATLELPTFEGPRVRVEADENGRAKVLAAGIVEHMEREAVDSDTPRVVVAYAPDPVSTSVADALSHAIADCGGDVDLLRASLAPVLSHAILGGAYGAGILVECASDRDRQCLLTIFGADGRPLDATPARRLRASMERGSEHETRKAGRLGQASCDGSSYLESLVGAFGTLGHVLRPASISLACAAPADTCGLVENALARIASKVEVVATAVHTDLDASLAQATELALERGFDVALAFDDALGRVACSAIADGRSTRLGDDEATELALAWLLAAPKTSPQSVTLVSDIGSTRAIDALAERFGAVLVRTLPGAEAVAREVAHQNASSPHGSVVVGVTADASLLVAGATGIPCPVALAMALAGAAADSQAQGRTLDEELRSIDDEIGCHRATRVSIAFETYDHAPLLMMRLRKDERDLVCHMVVTDTTDYLTGQPVPGDPTRTLPFFDAIGWTLSDGSTLVLYADEAASKAYALILVRADTRSEAQAVSFFLAQEAHAILTS